MTDVHRIDGAPGVGKTHTLREYIKDERDSGRSYIDMYYLTFSRSGVEDAEQALLDVFEGKDSDDVEKHARTLHSLALSVCAQAGVFDDFGEQIITQRQDEDFYRGFCDRRGLTYSGPARNHLKAMRDGEDLEAPGDKLFAINDWLTLKQYPPRRYHEAPQDVKWSHETATELLEAWDGYKRGHGLRRFEHADYVDEAIQQGFTPDADVLFIDEFQDLAPQEYRLFKTWRDSGELDTIYIAGDPNQSIYSFRAGTPLYFEETDVDANEELKESYRCPAEVASVAQRILDAAPETDPRGFCGRSPGGTVRNIGTEHQGDVRAVVRDAAERHDSVMVLARANYQVSALAKTLRGSTLPFSFLGRRAGAWDGDLTVLYNLFRELREGTATVPQAPVNKLLKYAPRSDTRRADLGALRDGAYEAGRVRAAFDDYDTLPDLARALDLDDRDAELLVPAMEADHDVVPADVQLGTIHAAKGLEADAVLLFDGYTNQLDTTYSDDPEVRAEEHRLYYVGATRASEELSIARGFFEHEAPPLEVVA
jgi:superfamily I DNA/RNA helicase